MIANLNQPTRTTVTHWRWARLWGIALLLALILRASHTTLAGGVTPPLWDIALPAATCLDQSHPNCHTSSPAIVDVNGDGRLDIVVGTNNGHVLAVDPDGDVLWDRDISGAFGMSPGTHQVHASPAVGDLDGDGQMEVVVAAGALNSETCTQGGVIVLNAAGQTRPGWPFLAADDVVDPAGCTDTIFSTPAMGDLDNDGDLEIVAGGFDKRLYAWEHDGDLVANFPIDSHHLARLGWDILEGRLADTIWSSPALADLDGDGYLDIIIGTDEGNFDDRWGGDSGGWECPYELPPGWSPGYCGGALYVVDLFGQSLPGFPIYIHEAIQSSPLVIDLDDDGWLEIIIGTGTFYHQNSPDHPTDEFRVYAWTHTGDPVAGWEGGRPTLAPVAASPAVGNLVGDAGLEVVAADITGNFYAWHANGGGVVGFPMTPLTIFGNRSNFNVGKGLVLADYDTIDSQMEILGTIGWEVTVVDGDGQQLTSPFYPCVRCFYTVGTLLNTPAVGDVDGDGQLELVAHNSRLYLWDLPESSDEADWPMFRRSANRVGAEPMPLAIYLDLEDLRLLPPVDGSGVRTLDLELRVPGAVELAWEITSPAPDVIQVTPAEGTTNGSHANVTLTVDYRDLADGWHDLGVLTLDVVAEALDGEVVTLSHSLPISVYAGPLQRHLLPLIAR